MNFLRIFGCFIFVLIVNKSFAQCIEYEKLLEYSNYWVYQNFEYNEKFFGIGLSSIERESYSVFRKSDLQRFDIETGDLDSYWRRTEIIGNHFYGINAISSDSSVLISQHLDNMESASPLIIYEKENESINGFYVLDENITLVTRDILTNENKIILYNKSDESYQTIRETSFVLEYCVMTKKYLVWSEGNQIFLYERNSNNTYIFTLQDQLAFAFIAGESLFAYSADKIYRLNQDSVFELVNENLSGNIQLPYSQNEIYQIYNDDFFIWVQNDKLYLYDILQAKITELSQDLEYTNTSYIISNDHICWMNFDSSNNYLTDKHIYYYNLNSHERFEVMKINKDDLVSGPAIEMKIVDSIMGLHLLKITDVTGVSKIEVYEFDLACINSTSIYENEFVKTWKLVNTLDSDLIILESEGHKNYQIMDNQGNIVETFISHDKNYHIDINNFRPGIYFLRDENNAIEKFIKL